jgi:hypothetical protein
MTRSPKSSRPRSKYSGSVSSSQSTMRLETTDLPTAVRFWDFRISEVDVAGPMMTHAASCFQLVTISEPLAWRVRNHRHDQRTANLDR